MKKWLKIVAILMVSALVFSCGGSGGSAEDNAPVKVSFIVDTPQSDIAKIATVDGSTATYKFYYAAVPQWAGDVDGFSSIQGATSAYGTAVADLTYVAMPNGYEPGTKGNLGYFAQGSWKFYAQVRKQNSGNTETVLYEGATNVVYINEANNQTISTGENTSIQANVITIDVTRVAAAGTANVSIDIEVPKLSASGTALTVTYSDGTTSTQVNNLASTATPTQTGNWVRFTGSADNLNTGSYTFTLTSKNGSTPVGGAVLAFDLIPGENRTITGTIENGVWQTTLLTINVPTLTVNVTGAATATVGSASTYTCTATASQLASGDSVAYQWYVNDAVATGTSTNGTYSFTPAAAGYYYVTCKAYVSGKLIASKTLGVTASPAN